jgi:hypothetical protein
MPNKPRSFLLDKQFMAGFLFWLLFGVIVCEVLNQTGLFDGGINVGLIAGMVALIYLISGFILNHYRSKALYSAQSRAECMRIERWANLVQALIGLGLIAGLPLLWWGVIKKLASAANHGGPGF